MRLTVCCTTLLAGLLSACASQSFWGYTDVGCPAPPAKNTAQLIDSDPLLTTTIKLLRNPSVSIMSDSGMLTPSSAMKKYLDSAVEAPNSALGQSKSTGSTSIEDIQLGRSVLSGSFSDDASRNFVASNADVGLQARTAMHEALDNAQTGLCAESELVPLPLAKNRADDAEAFVAKIEQRNGFQDARTSDGSAHVELGKFAVADSSLVREAMRLHSTDSFCSMYEAQTGKLLRSFASANARDVAEAKPTFDIARYLVAYESAYFRNGHVVAVSFDAKDAASKLVSELPTDVQTALGDKKATLIKAIGEKLQAVCVTKTDDKKSTCLVADSLGAASFVSRSGQSIQFSGVSVSVGEKGALRPNFEYPKVAAFGPQVLRVFVEAIFDAPAPHMYAVATSTACTEGLYSPSECLSDAIAKAPFSNGSALTNSDVVSRIDGDAASADAFATSVTGLAIRGANIAALNNEAVADSVQALAGVTLRKTVEKTEWTRAKSSQGSSVCSRKSSLMADTHD
ncbi:Uncharacterised protein [Burkholderia pseudomallei]|nr:Uncharacterised protein [Burkholderia pseudomallei]